MSPHLIVRRSHPQTLLCPACGAGLEPFKGLGVASPAYQMGAHFEALDEGIVVAPFKSITAKTNCTTPSPSNPSAATPETNYWSWIWSGIGAFRNHTYLLHSILFGPMQVFYVQYCFSLLQWSRRLCCQLSLDNRELLDWSERVAMQSCFLECITCIAEFVYSWA